MSPRKRVGLVSGVVPHISPCFGALASAKPLITSWRYLGMPPAGLVPGEIPRSRKAIPLEYDLLEFLFGVIVAPVVLPALVLRSVGEAVGEQAHYESGEITEEDYRKRKEDLTPRLEELEK